MKRQLKLSEYAKLKGCSIRTVWRRIFDGTLKVVRFETGRVCVSLEDGRDVVKE